MSNSNVKLKEQLIDSLGVDEEALNDNEKKALETFHDHGKRPLLVKALNFIGMVFDVVALIALIKTHYTTAIASFIFGNLIIFVSYKLNYSISARRFAKSTINSTEKTKYGKRVYLNHHQNIATRVKNRMDSKVYLVSTALASDPGEIKVWQLAVLMTDRRVHEQQPLLFKASYSFKDAETLHFNAEKLVFNAPRSAWKI